MSLLKRLGSRPPDEPASPGGSAKPDGPGKRIALLLIEDNLAQAQLVRELLLEVPDAFFQIVHVDRLSNAVQRLAKETFDVILSDLTLPDSEGLRTFEQVQAQAPLTPIVVFSGVSDVSMAVQAVQRGAQNYLIKGQVSGNDLVRALYEAIERHSQALQQKSPASRNKVLAFVGAKGGSGTTTVALNVATLLAAQQPTILVELRSYLGTLAAQLRKAPPETLETLLALPPKRWNEQLLRRCLMGASTGLHLLCAPPVVQERLSLTAAHIHPLVQGLLAIAECVVLDLNSADLPILRVAAQQVDCLTVVSEPDPVALKASRALLAGLEAWGISGTLAGVLLVQRGGAGNLPSATEIEASLRTPVLGVVPPAAEACLMAMTQGLPLVLSQPDHLAASALNEISKKMVTMAEPLQRP